jgi:hypothetical protein
MSFNVFICVSKVGLTLLSHILYSFALFPTLGYPTLMPLGEHYHSQCLTYINTGTKTQMQITGPQIEF